MRVVAMNAAIGHQTHQVKCRAVLFAVFHCTDKSLVFKKVSVLNGLRNSCQFLIHNTAGTDVGVTDLAVAHLTVGQTNVHAGSTDIGHRVFTHQLVKIRRVGGGNRIAVVGFIFAEAVHDAKKHCLFHFYQPFIINLNRKKGCFVQPQVV